MRVLVIGTGFGRQAMAPVYRGLGFDVEVVSPRDESALHRALNAGVDLVSVHSPPFLHRQHVTAAVDRGYPVLCDKPFGRNADEARAMRDHAARRAVPVASGSAGLSGKTSKIPRPRISSRRVIVAWR